MPINTGGTASSASSGKKNYGSPQTGAAGSVSGGSVRSTTGGGGYGGYGGAQSTGRAGAGYSGSGSAGTSRGGGPVGGGMGGNMGSQGGGNFGRSDTQSSGRMSLSGRMTQPVGASWENRARAVSRGPGISQFQSYSGPKGALSLNPNARMAAARSVGWNLPSWETRVPASPRELDLATRINLAENAKITNPMGGLQTGVLQGVGDVMRNRVLSQNYPDTLGGVLTQKNQFSPYNPDVRARLSQYGPMNPNYAATYGTLKSIMEGETAPVVGNALNYGNKYAIAHPESIKNPAQRPSAKTQRAFAGLTGPTFTSAANPRLQHTFGTLGSTPSDVAFGGPAPSYGRPQTQIASRGTGTRQPSRVQVASAAPRTGVSSSSAPASKPSFTVAQAKPRTRVAAAAAPKGIIITPTAGPPEPQVGTRSSSRKSRSQRMANALSSNRWSGGNRK